MANNEPDAKPCADCRTNPGTLEIRKRNLCNDCFQKYISSKVLKRMESYRFKHQSQSGKRKRLFLPISGGVSSLVLLQVLDAQVKKQLRQQGRTAYDLVVGHVKAPEEQQETNNGDESLSAWWKRLSAKFNEHQFLPIARIEDVLEHDPDLETNLEFLNLRRKTNEDNQAFTSRALRSASTVTSRSDLHQILLQRLIIALAKHNACESIIWGHSDSRLAAKVLAEVAKGRGGAVSTELADGISPYGLIFNYPLRDLFKNELELYLHSFDGEYDDCLVDKAMVGNERPPVSIRNTSIDTLLNTYIMSQGEKYPSIMANVVKTASKLQTPTVGEFQACELCGMPNTGDKENVLCYGCERMKQDIKI